jgi:acyl carrier protein
MALTDQLLLGYLRTSLGVSDLDSDSQLFSSGLVDSMSMMNLIAFLEDNTAIQVRGEDVTLDNFDTPRRIIQFAESHR